LNVIKINGKINKYQTNHLLKPDFGYIICTNMWKKLIEILNIFFFLWWDEKSDQK